MVRRGARVVDGLARQDRHDQQETQDVEETRLHQLGTADCQGALRSHTAKSHSKGQRSWSESDSHQEQYDTAFLIFPFALNYEKY